MYIRESTIIDAIKAEIARYIEDYRSNTLDYKRNKCVLEERLVAAKIGLDSHLDKLQHSFEQNVRNQGSTEEFE